MCIKMKAILVIDIDDEYLCKEVSVIKFTNGNTIFCSEILKPLPEKMKVDYDTITSAEVTEKVVAMGYNACIDEILASLPTLREEIK